MSMGGAWCQWRCSSKATSILSWHNPTLLVASAMAVATSFVFSLKKFQVHISDNTSLRKQIQLHHVCTSSYVLQEFSLPEVEFYLVHEGYTVNITLGSCTFLYLTLPSQVQRGILRAHPLVFPTWTTLGSDVNYIISCVEMLWALSWDVRSSIQHDLQKGVKEHCAH